MKLAGIVNVTNPVKGAFSQGDGETILLDFTQGAHGRAFCGVRTYDLPDPKAQLVTVSNPAVPLRSPVRMEWRRKWATYPSGL